MIELIEFNTFSTGWGTGAVIFGREADKISLIGVVLPYENERDLEKELHSRYGRMILNEGIGIETCSTLESYFSGKYTEFNEKPCLNRRSQFEKKVYDELKAIPYGEVISYKELAERCGSPNAARAVGNAVRKNPTPVLIPCHRVLKSDGSIGGWSGAPGWKERLLAIEGSRHSCR